MLVDVGVGCKTWGPFKLVKSLRSPCNENKMHKFKTLSIAISNPFPNKKRNGSPCGSTVERNVEGNQQSAPKFETRGTKGPHCDSMSPPVSPVELSVSVPQKMAGVLLTPSFGLQCARESRV